MKRKEFDWSLPKAITDRLSDASYGNQRVVAEEGHMLIILHKVPSPDHLHREKMVFWREPGGTLFCNGMGEGTQPMKSLLLEYEDKYRLLEKMGDDAQEAKEYFKVIRELTPVCRAVGNLAQALQSARTHAKADPFFLEIRDQSSDIHRNFELLLSEVKMTLDYKIAEHAEAGTEVSQKALDAQHKLNLLAALSFPLITVSTLFGMNLASGLENVSPALFWAVFGCGLAIGVVLRGWVSSPPGPKKN